MTARQPNWKSKVEIGLVMPAWSRRLAIVLEIALSGAQRGTVMRNVLFILVASVSCCATADAAGPIIGPLCIEGVKATPHHDLDSPSDDGVWTPTDYKLDPAQARNARLTVFNKAIPPSDKFESCRDVTKRMVADGSQPIVSGKLRALTLHALVFIGPSGNRIQINRDTTVNGKTVQSFSATLSTVDSGAIPVAGGSIDFRGSLLWIKPSEDVLATKNGIRGELEIEAWNRKITAVPITIGQGLTFVSTLEPKNESNVTVRMDLQNGLARLWAGDLVGLPSKAASGDLQLPPLSLKSANLQATRIGVVAANGVLDVTFSGLKGSAGEAVIPGPQLQWKANAASLAIDRADGRAIQQPSMLTVAHAAFRGLSIRNAETILQSSAGAELFRGTADSTFAELSEQNRSVNSTWTNVSSASLAPILPGGIARMEWNESGPTTGLSVNGKFDVNRLKLGGIDLGQPLSFALLPSSLTGNIVIPVRVDIPTAAGSISFLKGDQTVALQGRLEQFKIDGTLVIPLSDLNASRLEVARDNLLVTVGAAVSVSPFIAGAKPNFLGAKVAVVNDSDIRVSSVGGAGTALLTTSTLLLAQPVIKVGDNGTENPATIDLKSEGMAKLRYDLATSKSTLVQAKLNATDTRFSLLGAEPRILDLGGDRITNPTVSLKLISVEIDQLSEMKVERAELDTLSITASSLAKMRSPGAATGLAYSGVLSGPITLGMARAARVSVGDVIVLSGFEINALDLSITDASVDIGGGISVAHGALALKVGQIREVALSDRRFRQVQEAQLSVGGKLVVHSPAMSINDSVDTRISLGLNGPDDALNGTGSLNFGTFTGSARSQFGIKFDCRETGQLNVDMETNMLVGGGSFQARMVNGKLSADGATGPIMAAAHSLHPTGCDNPVTKHIVQAQGKWWTDGICSKWFEIYHCRWESPEVSYAYHVHLGVESISVAVLMSNPHVYLSSQSEVSVCNLGAVVITPILPLVGGFSPGIDSPYPGLDNIVNGLIQFGFEPFQSLVMSGLGTGVGWFASSITSAAGNLLCIGKPL